MAVVNYTPEQTLELVTAYVANPSVEVIETFAEKFGKTVKSIISKLSREGVYKKVEKQTTTKNSSKEELVLAFELAAQTELPSMKHMTKVDLEKLLNFMRIKGN